MCFKYSTTNRACGFQFGQYRALQSTHKNSIKWLYRGISFEFLLTEEKGWCRKKYLIALAQIQAFFFFNNLSTHRIIQRISPGMALKLRYVTLRKLLQFSLVSMYNSGECEFFFFLSRSLQRWVNIQMCRISKAYVSVTRERHIYWSWKGTNLHSKESINKVHSEIVQCISWEIVRGECMQSSQQMYAFQS